MKITDKHVFFYVEWPSNFVKTKFVWEAFGEKHEFFCTEQAFMWAKAMYFNSPEEAKEILSTEAEGNTPMWCKQCGRWVKNYDDKKWDLVRYSFMYEVNLCKYKQDKRLQDKLLDPKFDGKTFVEASPTDCIWGIGLGENDPNIDNKRNWKGKNLLGKAITEVRNTLIHDMSQTNNDDIQLEYGNLGHLHVRTSGKHKIEVLCSGIRTNAKNEEIVKCKSNYPTDWMDMFNVQLSLFIDEVCISFTYDLYGLQVRFNSYDISDAEIDFLDVGKVIEATTNVFEKYHLEDISEEFYKKIEQDVVEEVFKKIC